MKILLLVIFLAFLSTSPAFGGPVTIQPTDQCPLCGMYPARYPRFHCQVVFEDGSYKAFDSAIGLLVYLYFSEKIGVRLKPVSEIYFKDYVQGKWLPSQNTFFVVDSGLLGPMGKEFVAVGDKEVALKLMEKEDGEEVVHFRDVDQSYLTNAAKRGWLHYLAKKLVLQ